MVSLVTDISNNNTTPAEETEVLKPRRGSKKHVNQEQLALIKSNLLNPNEVTFCDVTDDDEDDDDYLSGADSHNDGEHTTNRRKRLVSIDTDTDSIASSTTTIPKKKYTIPDGGYGWVVVLSSFLISLIIDGISFSFGLLYSEFLVYFNEGESKTAWIGALFLSVPLMSGPIMSNLVDTYGCRKMTIIGGVIGGTGFVLASMSNSVEMLYFTFGILAGLGLGITYVTAVVSIAFWFDKKRTFAVGIGASGTGIGTFLYAPLTQFLLDQYGWRGTTLILAGTLYNLCVLGAILRDPDWLIEENRLESRSQSVQTFSNSSVHLDEIKKMLDSGVKREDVLDTLVTNYNTEANQQINVPEEHDRAKKYQSEMHLPTFIISQEIEFTKPSARHGGSWRSLRTDKTVTDKEVCLSPTSLKPIITGNQLRVNLASMETLNPNEKDSYHDYETAHGSIDSGLHEDSHRRLSLDESIFKSPNNDVYSSNYKMRGMSLDAIDETEMVGNTTVIVPVSPPHDNRAQQKMRKRRFDLQKGGSLRRPPPQSHYFRNMVIHRNSINYRNAMLNTHRYRMRASSCPNIYRNSMTTIAREEEEKWYDSFTDVIKSIFDFSLFLDIKFFVFNLSTLLLFIWFIVPYFYITEYLLKCGYTDDAGAKLISVIGISQTFGMIALGWLGDRPNVDVAKTYGICLVFCGLSVFLMPLMVNNYPILIVLNGLFGITFASSFSFTPIILANLVDLDDFTCAYGLVLLVQGIGNLIGPPASSMVFSWTGTWDYSFYAAGFFIVLSGLLAYLTGILQKRHKDEASSKASDLSSTVSIKKSIA